MSFELWSKLCEPPKTALKRIQGGKLKGKSDINPQWRYLALTEVFGACGIGWKFDVVRKWTENGANGEVLAFVDILFYYRWEGEWAGPIHGTGGSTLVAEEKGRLVSNDEAFKMALTDALSVATKMIGVAARVYLGQFDGKYSVEDLPGDKGNGAAKPPAPTTNGAKTGGYVDTKKIAEILSNNEISVKQCLRYLKSIDAIQDEGKGLNGIKIVFAKRIIANPGKFAIACRKYLVENPEKKIGDEGEKPKEEKPPEAQKPRYATAPQKRAIEAIIKKEKLNRDLVKEYLLKEGLLTLDEDGTATLSKLHIESAKQILDNPKVFVETIMDYEREKK